MADKKKQTMYFCDNCFFPMYTKMGEKAERWMYENEATDFIRAGGDVFLSEVYGLAPCYPSKRFSVEEHMEWYLGEYGGKEGFKGRGGDYWLNYVRAGGDPLREQMDATHAAGGKWYISFRMNDVHCLNFVEDRNESSPFFISRFYYENPQYRIGGERQNNVGNSVWALDYQHEAVREYKLSMIEELIESYDIDGFVLDYMRIMAYFNLQSTTERQRKDIMTDFVGRVRAMLDKKTAITGKHYPLAVQIPIENGRYGDLGLDVVAMHRAGVDRFMLFEHFYTMNSFDWLGQLKRLCPDAEVYATLGYASTFRGGDTRIRVAKNEELCTAAYVAYSHGADGVALHNFPWFRCFIGKVPFEVISRLTDEEHLKTAPQIYFSGNRWDMLAYDFLCTRHTLAKDGKMEFIIDMYPPEDGWREDGVLRFECVDRLRELEFEAMFNGVSLERVYLTKEPLGSKVNEVVEGSDNWVCFSVPKALLNSGHNAISIRNLSDAKVKFLFIDLSLPNI